MTARNLAVFSKTIDRSAARLIGLFGIDIWWSTWLGRKSAPADNKMIGTWQLGFGT
jgi:hypothetical protein